ncbi:trk system potassium uptake protein TrkH [Paenibacillus shirakamiensis]|uniref:Trk system potassium uptake protein TrkH n=1 Tax=Paenibacillus shirakamiensis TaxID=1265935 RepID=A0ABS4JK82_9BACL|nr:TrkH family potassium uptake protein [Paenibacillus shirakamiensis]MBP2002098.1 trk system potassium uptake protein TrkH [Paenibacillus shirakamiensis]
MKWNKIRLSPPQILVFGFAFIIMVGTILLMLPLSNMSGHALPFVDALFTATSSTCVTGLVVRDTGLDFTIFGQIVIMSLIQIGGLGFMTMATLFSLVLKRKISLKDRLLLQESLNQNSMEGIVRLIRKVLKYSLVIELCAAIIFAIRWSADMPVGKAVYFGIFHAISMFNNAGFDLFGHYQSLMGYVGDPWINLTTMVLIITGGLGFIVLSDLISYRTNPKLSLQSKVVLSMTVALLTLGTLIIFIFELTNPKTLESLDWGSKIWGAMFQSVTSRTAGANTLDISSLRQATQFFIMILMFIGASPGSTGGGIKTTTFSVLLGAVIAMVRGREDVVLFHYRLAQERIFKAVTITMVALFLIIAVTMTLAATEEGSFLSIMFETTSAFGTVGLSMGLTPHLTSFGKLLICLTMFAGRLGLLTLAYALGPKKSRELYRHPEGKMFLG